VDLSPQGGVLSTIAVDLHGERVVVGMAGENAGVFQIASDQALVPLVAAAKPVSLTFSEDNQKLYILDSGSMQVSELNLADSNSQSWPVAELEDPIAVRAARDSAQLSVIYVAGGKDQALVVYDLSTHEAISRVPLSFQPNRIEGLGKNSYLLRPRVSFDDPLWSFRNSSPPMVFFVPATPLIVGEDSSR
jgi:DNA-binding beta-propeller fold protein YncE